MANTAENDVKLSEIVRNSLNEVLSKELCSEKIDVTIEPGSKKGDNTVGIVYSVSGKSSADIPNGNARNKVSTKMFLKVAPPVKGIRAEFFLRFCFLREIRMYDEVLPMFRRLQESNGLNVEKDRFHEYPKCYKTIDAVEDEALIFQDLKADRFEMFDRFQMITIDHVRLVMKALGKYHALSFALRVRPLGNYFEIIRMKSDIKVISFAGPTARKIWRLIENGRSIRSTRGRKL